MLWSIDSCQNRVSVDQYHVTVSLVQVLTHRDYVFLKVSADKLVVFNGSQAQLYVDFFLKGYKLIVRKNINLWTGASPLALAKFIWYRIHIVCYILLLFYFSLTKGSKFLTQDLC